MIRQPNKRLTHERQLRHAWARTSPDMSGWTQAGPTLDVSASDAGPLGPNAFKKHQSMFLFV